MSKSISIYKHRSPPHNNEDRIGRHTITIKRN